MEFLHTNLAPAAIGPYSQGIKSGSLVFFSGQIALDPTSGELVGTTTAEQIQQVIKNLQGLLDRNNLARENIIKTSIFLVNLSDFELVNQHYADWLGSHRPARSTVEVSALPKGASVEIEMIVES